MSEARAPIQIVADDRELTSGVIDELCRRVDDVALEVRRLEVADFLVEGNFAVERKTLRDFAASVIDTRLFKQAALLAQNGRRGMLILEGGASTSGDLGVSREALQGALITVSVFYRPAVLRSRDVSETARLLVYLGRQAQRFARGGLTRPGYRPKGKRARQMFVLQGLPGIGPGRAKLLLEHFGSVQNAANASSTELAAVNGIGESTAARMRWAIEETGALYEP